MTWSTISKVMITGATTSHRHTDPKVVGRTPSGTALVITPSELFGAAARSSHLHAINIAIATPESVVMARLIEQHVDDTSPDFAILSKADTLKDYVKSYFSGTVAAGLAYLFMEREGYVWSDHFENMKGGNPKHGRKPDFVFSGPTTGLALVEAKGSRSGSIRGFDSTVLDGYSGQVEPHLGHVVGSQTAVRGYSIGSWMKSTTAAQFRVHHTAPPPPTSATALPFPGIDDGEVATDIQKNNFATAFGLAHSPVLANALRHGTDGLRYTERVPFLRFRWLDQYWVTNPLVPSAIWKVASHLPLTHLHEISGWPWLRPFVQSHMFAIRADVAKLALQSFLNDAVDTDRSPIPFAVMEDDLRNRARGLDREGRGGAVFADGLALITAGSAIDELEFVYWRRGYSDFN